MTNAKKRRDGHRSKTFEDLRGLRAEGYIRDSTLDQRDGFGPTIQRHNMERFAESYGMELETRPKSPNSLQNRHSPDTNFGSESG